MGGSGMAGAVGQSILFFMVLALQGILTAGVLAYAAHSFLVVVQDTSAGNDRVVWPDEAMVDWLWKFVYLLWLVAVCVVPSGLVAKLLPASVFTEWRVPVASLAAFWLLFPVALLSSLGGESKVYVLRPKLLGLLLRVPGATLGCYLSTGLLLGASAALTALTYGGHWTFTPLAAVAAGTTVLIYARLMGRLAWRVGRSEAKKARRPRRDRTEPRAAPGDDPFVAAPPPPPRKQAPPPKGKLPVIGYGLAGDEPEPEAPRPRKKAAPLVDGYRVSKEPPPERPKLDPLDGYLPAEDRDDKDRADPDGPPRTRPAGSKRGDPPAEAASLTHGVYSFPWYDTSLKAWSWLCSGALVVAILTHVLTALFPG